MKTGLSVIFFAVILVVVDLLVAKLADRIAINHAKSISEVAIDWSSSGKQNCKRSRSLLLYQYQTCYYVRSYRKNKGDWITTFYYHPPRPIFHLSRVVMSTNYYFGELVLGETIKTIKYLE